MWCGYSSVAQIAIFFLSLLLLALPDGRLLRSACPFRLPHAPILSLPFPCTVPLFRSNREHVRKLKVSLSTLASCWTTFSLSSNGSSARVFTPSAPHLRRRTPSSTWRRTTEISYQARFDPRVLLACDELHPVAVLEDPRKSHQAPRSRGSRR